LVLAIAASGLASCGGDDDEDENPDDGIEQGDIPLGETAIVTVVNPVPNEGNTVPVPAELAQERAGVSVNANPGSEDTTDETGLAVVHELGAGMLDLVFGGPDGPALPFTVTSDGDVYDLAVAYNGQAVVAIENFPIRYAVGTDVSRFAETASAADVGNALGTDGTIVVLERGLYTGDLHITGDNILFFGEGFTERRVVIDGSVQVSGTGVRIRGFTITGNIIVEGNGFGMAFTTVQGTTDIRGNAVAFLRNAFCGNPMVPSSSASLFDNEGMAPLPDPIEECVPPDGGAP
jgi:hypothetical protein